MARLSLFWRCKKCKQATAKTSCRHPGGAWSVYYRVNGKPTSKTVGRNKKDAERRLAELQNQLNQGTYQPQKPITFDVFSQQWLKEYAQPKVKLTTMRSYKNMIRVHLKPVFEHKQIGAMTTQDIYVFRAKLLEKGRSRKTANNALTLLKTIMKYAKRCGFVYRNAAEDVEPLKVDKKEAEALNPQELQLLLKKAEEPYKTLFLAAAFTGMRRGELLGLQWGDIDWNKNLIYVRRALVWANAKDEQGTDGHRWLFDTPKSRSSKRSIVMSPKLKDALTLHRLSCPASPHDLVFCGKDGQPMDPDNMVKREFMPTLGSAGIRHVPFHALRHTYATLLIEQKENIKFIQSQLGHASIQMTMDQYGHVLPQSSHGVGERLDALVFAANTSDGATKEGDAANAPQTEHPVAS